MPPTAVFKTSLEKLQSQVDSRRQKEVHSACAAALSNLPKEQQVQSSAVERTVWEPFKLALNSKNPPQLRQHALDVFQKLVAFGHVRGDQWVDDEVASVDDAAATANGDDNAPPPSSATTDHSLPPSQPPTSSITTGDLNAASEKDQQAQSPTAASTTAPPPAGTVLASSYPPMLIDDMVHAICLSASASSFTTTSNVAAENMVHLQIVKALLTIVTASTCEVHEASLLKCLQACLNIHLYSANVNTQTTARAGLTQMCHHVFSLIQPLKDDASSQKSAPELSSADSAASRVPAGTMEKSLPSSRDNNPYTLTGEAKLDMSLRDAYLTFKFVCRLALKIEKSASAQSAPSQQQEPRRDGTELSELLVRARTLGLEMVLSILSSNNHIFQRYESFAALVKSQVTLAVSKNGLLLHAAAFEYALSIFLVLVRSFLWTVKQEVDVLFNEIYLYLLNNPFSTRKQKILVLQGLCKLCLNPQMLVDLYVNYDCDFDMTNVFERLLETLQRLAKGLPANAPLPAVNAGKASSGSSNSLQSNNSVKSPIDASHKSVNYFAVDYAGVPSSEVELERTVRGRAFQCIMSIVWSLHQWTKPEDEDQSAVSQERSAMVVSPSSSSAEARETSDGVASPPGAGDSDANTPGTQSPSRTPAINTPNAIPVILNKNPLSALNLTQPALASPNPGVNSSVVTDANEIERQKNRKQQLRTACVKFNDSPGKGLKLLREHNFIPADDLQATVNFLRTTGELTKAAIGDCLGDGKDNGIQLMHAFVDSFNFKGQDFVAALRSFLQTFRLPGEAQKIDRIMEKFAARYCDDNPKLFANADVAYTLAFSIMMLNTDQHSSRIKNRMTKADFIKNNRGINDNADLPEELLSKIFDEISKNEIVMDEERTVKELEKMAAVGVNQDASNRRELFKLETHEVQKKSAVLMKKTADKVVAPFAHAVHRDHARPMFTLVWPQTLALINTMFDDCQVEEISLDALSVDAIPRGITNKELAVMCLYGLRLMVVIAFDLVMDDERRIFIASLCHLTGVQESSKLSAKNAVALKLLFVMSLASGNQLADGWHNVFQCVSAVDRLASAGTRSSVDPALMTMLRSQEFTISIDKIFASSAKLDGQSILHFYRSLCQVAETEVDEGRNYLTQKVVEISYYNMDRIRLEWMQILKILTAFFSKIGSRPNVEAATYAVDSLRQLCMKFLNRSELTHFHTNADFLKPFESIARATPMPEVRDLVVQSVQQMVVSRPENIKSGWKSVFVVLTSVVSSRTTPADATLIDRCFHVMGMILENHMASIDEYIADCAACLTEFILYDCKDQRSITAYATPSLSYVKSLAEHLARKEGGGEHGISDDTFHLKWFPILGGLARVIRDANNTSIRGQAVDCLFSGILGERGAVFSFERGHWRSIVKSIVLPLFEDLVSPSSPTSPTSANAAAAAALKDSNTSATWIQCIRRVVEVVSAHFKPRWATIDTSNECFRAHPELVSTVLDLIVKLCNSGSENMSTAGITYFGQFVQNNWEAFDESTWALVTNALQRVVHSTLPKELLGFKREHLVNVTHEAAAHILSKLKASIGKCSVHLTALQLIRELALIFDDLSVHLIADNSTVNTNDSEVHAFPSPIFQAIPPAYASQWLALVKESHEYAREFNGNYELRSSLLKANVVSQMANLLRQETQAQSTYVSILFHMYRLTGDDASSFLTLQSGKQVPLVDELCACCDDTMAKFTALLGDQSKHARELAAWASVVKLILYEFGAVTQNWQQQQAENDADNGTKSYQACVRRLGQFHGFAVAVLAHERSPAELRSAARHLLEQCGRLLALPAVQEALTTNSMSPASIEKEQQAALGA